MEIILQDGDTVTINDRKYRVTVGYGLKPKLKRIF